VDLQGLRGGGRRVFAPQVVDQAVARDDLARVEQQKGEQRLQLAPSDRDLATVVANLERSKDPEFDGRPLPLRRPYQRPKAR
jgi:hypothetical protein